MRDYGRSLLAFLLVAALLHAVHAAPAQAQATAAPAEARISWFGAAGPWVLGKALGSFEQALGTKVVWRQLAAGGAVLSALAAEEVDISLLGSPPTVAGISRGLPIKVIALEGVIGSSERLIVRDTIHSVKELIGKRLAYPPGSSSHYGLNAAIKAYTLDPGKLTLLGLAPTDMVAAWKRGDIDGGFVWSPFSYQMESDKGHELLTMKDLRPFGYLVWNNYVVRTTFAKQYPQAVVGFLKAYRASVAAYKADPQHVSEQIAAHLGQNVVDVRNTMQGRDYFIFEDQLTNDWLGNPQTKGQSRIAAAMADTASFLVETGDVKRADVPPSFAPSIQPSFMEQALH
jgi:taurine transport system substrate-binding protein